MKAISTRPIFTLSLFSNSYHNLSLFSTITQHQNSNYSQRRQQEENRNVRVSVWWDFENCNIPINVNVFRVSSSITNAIRASGIKGPIQITAFGDVMQISRSNQEALSSSGICLTHVPSGGKNSADRSLLVDLMYWVSQNPPPAHLFLISGDRDFAGILHRLRMNNYNILLASPDSAPSVLCSAATIMWQWSSLLKGENLIGKNFNQPPDGLYNSWYGQPRLPLDDPFAIKNEQSLCLPANDSSELAPDSNLRPIPKPVMKHIHNVLNSYPEGIPLSQLRVEVIKGNITIDKDLYGYKKFFRFLSAMPQVIKIHLRDDGQYIAYRVNHKEDSVPTTYMEPVKVCSDSKPKNVMGSSDNVNEKTIVSGVSDSKMKSQSEDPKEEKVYESTPSVNIQEVKIKAGAPKVKAQVRSFPQKEERVDESSSAMNMDKVKVESFEDPKKGEKVIESTPALTMQNIQEQDKNVESQEQQKKVEAVSPEIKDFSEKNENQLVGKIEHTGFFRRIWMKLYGSGDPSSTEKKCYKLDKTFNNVEEKNLLSSSSADIVSTVLFSPSSHEALILRNIDRDSKICVTDISSEDSSFSNKAENNFEKVDDMKITPTPQHIELFSKDSFWNELESFVGTSQGSALILQSRTRKHLAQDLRRKGPSVLRFLPQSELLHLVDMLISDKKWVKECDSETSPFKLTRPHKKDSCSNTTSLRSNGLSHIFTLPKPQELGDKKLQNPPHTGVPQTRKGIKGSSEILKDCQKVVDYIVKNHPEGFNMGSFRKLFVERNGYALDIQNLGYDKLANLLQIMSGAKLEDSMIYPAGSFNIIDHYIQELESSDNNISSKNEDKDIWAELGPVAHSNFYKVETGSRFCKDGQKAMKKENYEPVDDSNFSDSDENEDSRIDESTKKKDDSNLIELLDSYYLSKESDDDNMKESTVNPIRKQKPGRSYYTFVKEKQVNSDRLIGGILGSMKNTGEKSSEKVLS